MFCSDIFSRLKFSGSLFWQILFKSFGVWVNKNMFCLRFSMELNFIFLRSSYFNSWFYLVRKAICSDCIWMVSSISFYKTFELIWGVVRLFCVGMLEVRSFSIVRVFMDFSFFHKQLLIRMFKLISPKEGSEINFWSTSSSFSFIKNLLKKSVDSSKY